MIELENIKNLENISESPDFQKSPISEHSQDLINSDNVEIQLLKVKTILIVN